MSVLKVGEADDELAAALADQNKLGQRQENRRRVIWVDRVFPFKLGARYKEGVINRIDRWVSGCGIKTGSLSRDASSQISRGHGTRKERPTCRSL
jgi:hypothetical protein